MTVGLARLEAEGFALRGRFVQPATASEQWCARRLLARIHAYTRQRLRREIEPVTPRDFVRFLLRWQHVDAGHPSAKAGRACSPWSSSCRGSRSPPARGRKRSSRPG